MPAKVVVLQDAVTCCTQISISMRQETYVKRLAAHFCSGAADAATGSRLTREVAVHHLAPLVEVFYNVLLSDLIRDTTHIQAWATAMPA